MTCKGQIAEQNANEHVLAIAPQGNLQMSPNFFWNFSHVFNTEARIFDHFLNFPNRANVHTYAYFLKTINTEYTYLVFEESGIRTSSISQIKSLHPEWFIIILDPDVSFRMESNISLMGLYPTCRIKISTINTEHLK